MKHARVPTVAELMAMSDAELMDKRVEFGRVIVDLDEQLGSRPDDGTPESAVWRKRAQFARAVHQHGLRVAKQTLLLRFKERGGVRGDRMMEVVKAARALRALSTLPEDRVPQADWDWAWEHLDATIASLDALIAEQDAERLATDDGSV